jgi:hypothetical protein
MRPKQFFSEITLGSKWKAEDPRPWADWFFWKRVIRRDTPINNLPSHDINVINLRTQSQTSRKFEHIQGLTAGIGITAEL